MTATVYTPFSNGKMTMEEYGPGAFVTGAAIRETRRATNTNPQGQLWERLLEASND